MLNATNILAAAMSTTARSEPRLETFPSPMRPSEEEAFLVLFVRRAPAEAFAAAVEQEQYRRDVDARIRSLSGESR